MNGVLDPVGGAILEETLRLIQDELRRADETSGVVRAAGARRAAALVEMATRARSLPEGQGRRPVPLFTVILGEGTFADTCELFTGQVITPADLRAWLDQASVQFFRFDHTPPASDPPESGARGAGQSSAAGDDVCAGNGPMAASRKQARFFTGTLRTAIQLRDRHCQHPSGCDEPISRCDIDHVTPHSHGGTTTLTGGRLLCTAHNRIPALRDPGQPDGDGARESDPP